MKSGRADKQLTGTSRFISLILRHKPETIGITLDEHGWADVKELIDGINRSMESTDHPVIRLIWNYWKRSSGQMKNSVIPSMKIIR